MARLPLRRRPAWLPLLRFDLHLTYIKLTLYLHLTYIELTLNLHRHDCAIAKCKCTLCSMARLSRKQTHASSLAGRGRTLLSVGIASGVVQNCASNKARARTKSTKTWSNVVVEHDADRSLIPEIETTALYMALYRRLNKLSAATISVATLSCAKSNRVTV